MRMIISKMIANIFTREAWNDVNIFIRADPLGKLPSRAKSHHEHSIRRCWGVNCPEKCDHKYRVVEKIARGGPVGRHGSD